MKTRAHPSRGGRRDVYGVLALLAVLLPAWPSAAETGPEPVAPDPVGIRLGEPSVNPAWVGQQVIVPVILTMAEYPSEAPKLHVPEVPGGVFLYVPGAALFDRDEDEDFITWKYSFVFYPHRPGTHTILGVGADVRMPDEEKTSRWHSVTSDALTLRSRMPEGAEDASLLVTAPRLEVEETWSPDQTEVRLGDAVTRTVTLRASEVLGMGLPPLTFEAPPGIAAYPRPPALGDEAVGGEVTGERSETVVYVCEQEGSVTLPAIVIPWFEPQSGTLKRIELPERTLRVAPNPAVAMDSPDQDALPSSGSRSRAAVVAVLLAAAVVVLAWRYGGRWSAAVDRWRAHGKKNRVAGLPPLNPGRE